MNATVFLRYHAYEGCFSYTETKAVVVRNATSIYHIGARIDDKLSSLSMCLSDMTAVVVLINAG